MLATVFFSYNLDVGEKHLFTVVVYSCRFRYLQERPHLRYNRLKLIPFEGFASKTHTHYGMLPLQRDL
jgi:hypothetical protein